MITHEWVPEKVTPDIESRYGRGSLVGDLHLCFWRCNNCGYGLYSDKIPDPNKKVDVYSSLVTCEEICVNHVHRIMNG